MKRGFSDSPSSSAPPPSSRFKSNPEGDSQFLEDETTKNFARKVADHYSRRTNQTLEEREASPIIHLKKLNNWVGYSLTSLSVRETCCIMIIQFCSSFSYSYTNRLKVF
jgi:mRNA (guanine-N7-)-methyltransferase